MTFHWGYLARGHAPCSQGLFHLCIGRGHGAPQHLTTTPDRSYLVPDVPLGLLALVRELGSE